jgi:hypothetical protein
VDEDDGNANQDADAEQAGPTAGGEPGPRSSFVQLPADEPASLASLLENESDISNAIRWAIVHILLFRERLGRNACKSVPSQIRLQQARVLC